MLANPPEPVAKILKEANPNASYASWAIKFAANLDGVITVLSGMSNIEQMEDNLSYMKGMSYEYWYIRFIHSNEYANIVW